MPLGFPLPTYLSRLMLGVGIMEEGDRNGRGGGKERKRARQRGTVAGRLYYLLLYITPSRGNFPPLVDHHRPGLLSIHPSIHPSIHLWRFRPRHIFYSARHERESKGTRGEGGGWFLSLPLASALYIYIYIYITYTRYFKTGKAGSLTRCLFSPGPSKGYR